MSDQQASTYCLWIEDWSGECWFTCGDPWTFTEGGPEENGVKFCPLCGRPAKFEHYKDEEEVEIEP